MVPAGDEITDLGDEVAGESGGPAVLVSPLVVAPRDDVELATGRGDVRAIGEYPVCLTELLGSLFGVVSVTVRHAGASLPIRSRRHQSDSRNTWAEYPDQTIVTKVFTHNCHRCR